MSVFCAKHYARARSAIAHVIPDNAVYADEAIQLALAQDAHPVGTDETSTVSPSPRLWIDSASVRIDWDGKTETLRPMKGLVDLATLIGRRPQEVHVLELMGSALDQGAAGPVIDDRARAAYEARIRELQEELDEANAHNDLGRQADLEAEFDGVVEQLSRALGLHGRARKQGSTVEKARQAVTWRVRAAIKKIAVQNPDCARHFERSVRTGSFCCYDPEVDPGWQVSAGSDVAPHSKVIS